MSRGIDRRAVFFDDRDRLHFLEILESAQSRFRLRIHAYVLMDNHFHLIICTPDRNLSRAMQWIKVSYSMWFNVKHRRVGPLFQGRFRSELVDSVDGWLVNLSVYVHLNPVRVKKLGLDKRGKAAEAKGWLRPNPDEARRRLNVLRDYRWSSYPAYAGLNRRVPDWLDLSDVLERMEGRDPRAAYLRMTERCITQGHEEEFLNRLKNRLAIGSAAFLEEVRALCNSVDRDVAGHKELREMCSWTDLVSAVEGLLGKGWADLQRRGEWGRYLVYWGAQRYVGMTLKEIAEQCGLKDYGSVNMGIRRLSVRAEQSRDIRNAMKKLDKMFNVQT